MVAASHLTPASDLVGLPLTPPVLGFGPEQELADRGQVTVDGGQHRRYSQRPDLKRAELIEGVVYVPSPTRFTWHDKQAALMIFWLSTYAIPHPEIQVDGSATIYLDEHNESEVFPGLRLDLARLLAGDRAGLVAALRA